MGKINQEEFVDGVGFFLAANGYVGDFSKSNVADAIKLEVEAQNLSEVILAAEEPVTKKALATEDTYSFVHFYNEANEPSIKFTKTEFVKLLKDVVTFTVTATQKLAEAQQADFVGSASFR